MSETYNLHEMEGKCDLCGENCDSTTDELNAIDCTFDGCDTMMYHQVCLENYLRSARLDKQRKTGFPCPRGCGKGSVSDKPCPGRVTKSHPIHARNDNSKKRRKAKLPEPFPQVLPKKVEKKKEEVEKKATPKAADKVAKEDKFTPTTFASASSPKSTVTAISIGKPVALVVGKSVTVKSEVSSASKAVAAKEPIIVRVGKTPALSSLGAFGSGTSPRQPVPPPPPQPNAWARPHNLHLQAAVATSPLPSPPTNWQDQPTPRQAAAVSAVAGNSIQLAPLIVRQAGGSSTLDGLSTPSSPRSVLSDKSQQQQNKLPIQQLQQSAIVGMVDEEEEKRRARIRARNERKHQQRAARKAKIFDDVGQAPAGPESQDDSSASPGSSRPATAAGHGGDLSSLREAAATLVAERKIVQYSQKLQECGFSEDLSQRAVRTIGADLEKCVAWLLDGGAGDDQGEPPRMDLTEELCQLDELEQYLKVPESLLYEAVIKHHGDLQTAAAWVMDSQIEASSDGSQSPAPSLSPTGQSLSTSPAPRSQESQASSDVWVNSRAPGVADSAVTATANASFGGNEHLGLGTKHVLQSAPLAVPAPKPAQGSILGHKDGPKLEESAKANLHSENTLNSSQWGGRGTWNTGSVNEKRSHLEPTRLFAPGQAAKQPTAGAPGALAPLGNASLGDGHNMLANSLPNGFGRSVVSGMAANYGPGSGSLGAWNVEGGRPVDGAAPNQFSLPRSAESQSAGPGNTLSSQSASNPVGAMSSSGSGNVQSAANLPSAQSHAPQDSSAALPSSNPLWYDGNTASAVQAIKKAWAAPLDVPAYDLFGSSFGGLSAVAAVTAASLPVPTDGLAAAGYDRLRDHPEELRSAISLGVLGASEIWGSPHGLGGGFSSAFARSSSGGFPFGRGGTIGQRGARPQQGYQEGAMDAFSGECGDGVPVSVAHLDKEWASGAPDEGLPAGLGLAGWGNSSLGGNGLTNACDSPLGGNRFCGFPGDWTSSAFPSNQRAHATASLTGFGFGGQAGGAVSNAYGRSGIAYGAVNAGTRMGMSHVTGRRTVSETVDEAELQSMLAALMCR